jgi:hypothetical protein
MEEAVALQPTADLDPMWAAARPDQIVAEVHAYTERAVILLAGVLSPTTTRP